MKTKTTLFGHPVHQMLVVFPLGLLATATMFDVVRLVTGKLALGIASYYMIAAGVLTGLVAAVFGLIDWLGIPGNTRAKAVGAWHAIGNVIVVLLFAASWFIRRGDAEEPASLAFLLALAGTALALVTGWLGGELVDRLGVGVHDGANLNAPSSLSHR